MTESAAAPAAESRLKHVPIPLFAVVMGLTGLGIAWQAADHTLGVPAFLGEAIVSLAALFFLAITGLYAAKWIHYPQAVYQEWKHPIRSVFFSTFSISLILLAIAALPHSRSLALVLVVLGAVLHLSLTLYQIGHWMICNHEIHHSSPAWFIPVVGNILVPIAMAPLGLGEVGWFFFSIGLVFWGVLFTIVFYRIVFHDQLPAKIMPTLFILIAPPAVGFVAYTSLNEGALDPLARILFFTALFLTLLIFTLARHFLKVPFAVSWWAVTFPLDAMTIAAFRYEHLLGLETNTMATVICILLLLVTTVVVTMVSIRTLKALKDDHLFQPE